MNFSINPELESFIPPLSNDEREKLRADLLEEGRAHAPLIVATYPDGSAELADGHNRYRLCTDLGLPYSVEYKSFPDREAVKKWMLKYQRSRRNLKRDQCIMLDLKQGADVSAYPPLAVVQAVEVLEKDPAAAAKIVRGERGIAAAWNDVRRREASASPTPFAKTKPKKGRIHVVIGDTQVKPGVPTQHLTWIGRYIAEQFAGENVAIVHLGDHWDMPSLSSYDENTAAAWNKTYKEDLRAGNDAFAVLNAPIERAMNTNKRWKPERYFLFGNHEDRITRAANRAGALQGTLSLDDCKTPGWQRVPFLQPLVLDGISYAHYFIAQNTGKPLGGENIETRLKTVGTSFTMGHQQGRKWAERTIANGKRLCGLICGSTYLHDEDYRGPQGNANWRGIVICHQVEDGQYDPMFVSLDYLCRRYEGKKLADFLRELERAA